MKALLYIYYIHIFIIYYYYKAFSFGVLLLKVQKDTEDTAKNTAFFFSV